MQKTQLDRLVPENRFDLWFDPVQGIIERDDEDFRVSRIWIESLGDCQPNQLSIQPLETAFKHPIYFLIHRGQIVTCRKILAERIPRQFTRPCVRVTPFELSEETGAQALIEFLVM